MNASTSRRSSFPPQSKVRKMALKLKDFETRMLRLCVSRRALTMVLTINWTYWNVHIQGCLTIYVFVNGITQCPSLVFPRRYCKSEDVLLVQVSNMTMLQIRYCRFSNDITGWGRRRSDQIPYEDSHKEISRSSGEEAPKVSKWKRKLT